MCRRFAISLCLETQKNNSSLRNTIVDAEAFKSLCEAVQKILAAQFIQ